MIRRTFLALTAAATMAGGAAVADGHSMDIVDTATKAADFSTLVAAVGAAGLAETLKGDGPFTVFAPTNAAFEALPEGTVENLLLPENKDMLTSILTYHVIPGKVIAADLKDGMTVETVNGAPMTIQTDPYVAIGESKVILADVEASNGVIHAVDQVIMPPES